MDNYDDRLQALEQEAFERAVTRATAIVSQNLAKLHRRRLVIQTAVATALVVGLLVVGAFVYNNAQAHNTTVNDVNYVCQTIKSQDKAMSDFIHTDAKLRIAQATSGVSHELTKDFEKIIKKSTLLKAEQRSNKEALATANRWLHVDEPILLKIARQRCNVK